MNDWIAQSLNNYHGRPLPEPGVPAGYAALIARFAELGTTPVSQEQATPEAHRRYWQADIAKWRPIIQAAGQYAD